MASARRGHSGWAIGQHAQALLEFAFVLPVMLILVLGVIEVGRGFVFGVAAQGGAREAARLAANARLNPTITTVVGQAGPNQTDAVIVQRLIDASAPALAGCQLPSPTATTPVTLSSCLTGTWTVTMAVTPNGSSTVYQSLAQALASSDAVNMRGGSVEVTAVSPTVSLLSGVATGWAGLRLYDIRVRGDATMAVL